jgi:glycerol-3-phosphate dehydrogenase
MDGIPRHPESAARDSFDLIVVGGGIYGCALMLEASRRGLRALLLERDDFGGATTRNSLRIVHGGLRYLQRIDLRRHRESVRERRRLLRDFEGLVAPLPCLLPLYGGLRSPWIMHAALTLDGLLSSDRTLAPAQRLPSAVTISPDRVIELFPGVRRQGLRGAALWYDGFMPHAPRVVMEHLHRACESGGVALNYVEARELLVARGRVSGVRARDSESGTDLEFRAPVVVNACGPECRELTRRFDRDRPELLERTLAWNVLLDAEPPPVAIGVAAAERGARTYFLVPWQGRMLAGTGHAPAGRAPRPTVSPTRLNAFLAEISAAVPGLKLGSVLRVYSGHLPGPRQGSDRLATRPVILDHGASNGPSGLWSVSGVKFTTARGVAEAALGRIHPDRSPVELMWDREKAGRRNGCTRFGPGWRPEADDGPWQEDLRRIVSEESVQHLDDLLLRRTSLGDDPRTGRALAARLSEFFGWEEPRRERELERAQTSLAEVGGDEP